jgi:methylenetetrahydrofolate reductase (NADPH)
MLSNEDLSNAIASFIDGYSIEVTPHDKGKFDEIAAELSPGTAVYIAHPPGMAIDEVVEFAGSIQARGFSAVPHIIARKLETAVQLERALARLNELDVHRALVVAGDIAVENGAFDSSLEVLQTGLFSKHGFKQVAVSGHPEGSKAIGEERVEKALLGKNEFAQAADFKMNMTTQFGFDPAAFVTWETETSAQGVNLPVHVGMAGPASLRQLAKFALMCGVGASARMLMTRTGATANLLRTQAPDEFVTYIARHRASNPETRLSQAHFFAFGGVAKTARWANAVRDGRFVLNSQATGFDIEK